MIGSLCLGETFEVENASNSMCFFTVVIQLSMKRRIKKGQGPDKGAKSYISSGNEEDARVSRCLKHFVTSDCVL